ncbi:hypothetical protein Q3A66_16035 [Hymenobacter sp. BT770]|uniref:hypothetical protein n=1 Tax=Hymenobacter sp. BT770 TaxID=2886942 RepID=UPI001D109418|nr:hypothetical protein [Hymenobacter sp. BT770]MCC3155529.1 hypothetical protein [Hymenobacter sp. BT770]MDO3416579.1 hypothetical protein [Hymenobacter sp. BT770]
MSFCVLFGLLFCCLACFREGVWTKYTPQDVARWKAQADPGRREPMPSRPVLASTLVSVSGELLAHTARSPRPEPVEAPAWQEVA